ncbi:hypothetical protein EAE99_004484 [Botrytis elliptica]|nr:hypothetical protein EAE99_004484 [Botrytis elliptica]
MTNRDTIIYPNLSMLVSNSSQTKLKKDLLPRRTENYFHGDASGVLAEPCLSENLISVKKEGGDNMAFFRRNGSPEINMSASQSLYCYEKKFVDLQHFLYIIAGVINTSPIRCRSEKLCICITKSSVLHAVPYTLKSATWRKSKGVEEMTSCSEVLYSEVDVWIVGVIVLCLIISMHFWYGMYYYIWDLVQWLQGGLDVARIERCLLICLLIGGVILNISFGVLLNMNPRQSSALLVQVEAVRQLDHMYMKPIGNNTYESVFLSSLSQLVATNLDDPSGSYLFPTLIEERIRYELLVRETVIFGIDKAFPGLLFILRSHTRNIR